MLKSQLNDLALFGGEPAFAEPLHVGFPNIGDHAEFISRIESILERRQLTNRGPYVREFEREIGRLVGVKHCIAMCNATVAMEIAARALGLSGEVIVPSMTFVATAHALQWQQITPVFCDVDPHTHTLDPERVDALITPRTTGIVGVHLWGQPCDVDGLDAIARRHGLKLLFDAAHAFGCSHRGRMIGGFGDAEIFSFHATKVLNTFEGGAVTTNNDELAEKIRLMQNFGFAGYDNVIHIGTNGKMSEVSAAMGLTSLRALDDFVSRNRGNYYAYRRWIGEIDGLKLINYDEAQRCNFHYIVAEVDSQRFGLTRDELARILTAENVLVRRYFFPGVHRMEPYRSYFPHAHLLLPNTEHLIHSVITFPNGSAVDQPRIDTIAGIMHFVRQHAGELRRLLRAPTTETTSVQSTIVHV